MATSKQTQQGLPDKSNAVDAGHNERAVDGNTEAAVVASGTRIDRIRLAAYLAAERRGFEPGHEERDWLEAEKQVDAQALDGSGDAELPPKLS